MRYFFLVFLTLLFPSPVFAGQFEDGLAALKRQDYQTALRTLQPLADQGNGQAQELMGDIYHNGDRTVRSTSLEYKWFGAAAESYRKAAIKGDVDAQVRLGRLCVRWLWSAKQDWGMKRDDADAMKWFLMAADQNNAEAQYQIGLIYFIGNDVKKDDGTAIKWFRKAAEQGNADAQYYLGSMYNDGKGVKQDYTDAVKWYRKAALQGEPAAQVSLGEIYEMGKGVKQDLVQAYMWYSLGAAAFRAALVLDGDYYSDKRIYFMSREMTPEEIAKAKRLVAEWKPSPAQPVVEKP